MAKYKKKLVVVEAEIYRAGLEDGFSCLPLVDECKFENENGYYRYCSQCKLDIPKKPYILNYPGPHNIKAISGVLFINEGDFIITDGDGNRFTCEKTLFEKTYEEVL